MGAIEIAQSQKWAAPLQLALFRGRHSCRAAIAICQCFFADHQIGHRRARTAQVIPASYSYGARSDDEHRMVCHAH